MVIAVSSDDRILRYLNDPIELNIKEFEKGLLIDLYTKYGDTAIDFVDGIKYYEIKEI